MDARLMFADGSELKIKMAQSANAWRKARLALGRQHGLGSVYAKRAAQNLAITHNALLAMIPFEPGQPLSHFYLFCRRPTKAPPLILHSLRLMNFQPNSPVSKLAGGGRADALQERQTVRLDSCHTKEGLLAAHLLRCEVFF